MRTIKILITTIMSGVVATLFFATLAMAATVEVKAKDGIGNYLTDEKGMTLYLFKKDAPGISACAGPCVDNWPPFIADNITVPDGVKADDFGIITREDGKKQTTYKGLPLYYFIKDKAAGDTFGNGVKGVWYVVAP